MIKNIFQPEDEIDRVFNSLGYSTSKTDSLFKNPLATNQLSNLTPLPKNLQPFMRDVPQKISNPEGNNFFTQFKNGILSPVTDTLSGFGVIKPRELPTGVAGIVGDMLGSIVGWTALTMLTAGVGTKLGLAARVGTSALKIGKATSLGKSLLIGAGKGALVGGLSQAHTWAFGQQEYENIPKEFLKGAITGGVLGAAGGAFTNYLYKTGRIVDTAGVLGDAVTHRSVEKMLAIDDPVAMNQAYRHLSGTYGTMYKRITQQTEVDLTLANALKTNIGKIKTDWQGKLPKSLSNILDDLSNAKNFGEISDLLKKTDDLFNRYGKKLINPEGFNKSSYKAQQKFSALQDLNLELHKQAKGFLSRVNNLDVGINLPKLSAVQDPKAAKLVQERIKELAKQEEGLRKFLDYGDEADSFLLKVSDETGVVYYPDASNFRSSDFLDGVAAKFKPEWEELVKRIKPGDINLLYSGVPSINIKSPLQTGDINKYFTNLKTLPRDIVHGISYMDTELLKAKPSWWSVNFSPLRFLVGETNFRPIRTAGVNATTAQSKWRERIMAIASKQGWTSDKFRRANGGLVGDIIEGNLADSSTLGQLYKTKSKELVALIGGDNKALDDFVKIVQKDFKLSKKRATKVLEDLTNLMASKDNMNQLVKIANRLGVEPDDLFGSLITNHIHKQKLLLANKMSKVSTLAKEMGVSEKHLKAAAEGSKLFDDLFAESGLDQAMYRAAYLPHFRKMDGSNYKTALAEFEKITDKKTIQNIFWANGLSRDGTLTAYDNNFFAAAERYMMGMTKKKYFEPVFKSVNKSLSQKSVSEARRKSYENLKRAIIGVPDDFAHSIDGSLTDFAYFLGQDSTPFTSKTIGAMLSEVQYAAGMGFNPFMPIRNLTQKALALSSISDSGSTVEGLYWLTKWKIAKATGDPKAQRLIRVNDILTNRVYAEALGLQSQGIANAAKYFGASDMAVNNWDNLMQNWAMKMFRWSDRSNVEDTFGARAMYLLNKGTNLADTVELARATTMATQFMYGIDSPMLYKTPLGKQIGIFQSWPLNWAQMMWEQGTQGAMKRAVSTVATMAVASELLSMTGISFRSIHPTETVQGILPLSMLEGENSWPLALRITSSALDYMRALGDGDEDAIDTAMNNFKRSAEGLVPFGVVTSRTLRFIDRAKHDWRDYADTGFLYTNALGSRRDEKSRLVRMLYDPETQGPMAGAIEAGLGWLGTTTKSVERQHDSEILSKMESSKKRTRRMAVQAFIDGDYNKFQRLQEQLVLNFHDWIEPVDIKRELQLMSMTARERQAYSLPQHLQDAFFESILDPRSPKSSF